LKPKNHPLLSILVHISSSTSRLDFLQASRFGLRARRPSLCFSLPALSFTQLLFFHLYPIPRTPVDVGFQLTYSLPLRFQPPSSSALPTCLPSSLKFVLQDRDFEHSWKGSSLGPTSSPLAYFVFARWLPTGEGPPPHPRSLGPLGRGVRAL